MIFDRIIWLCPLRSNAEEHVDTGAVNRAPTSLAMNCRPRSALGD